MPSKLRTILLAGLIAGTLDLNAAIFFLAKGQAERVCRYVASGAFGPAAFDGGSWMIASGILFHFTIAMTIATIYFFVYPHLPFLKANKILSAIFIGICAWTFMNLVVVPLSQIGPVKLTYVSIAKNMIILMVCIGLPISIIVSSYYRRLKDKS